MESLYIQKATPLQRGIIKQYLMCCVFIVVAAFAASSAMGGTTTYFHTDVQGSPIAASNDQGDIIWRRAYSPFGDIIQLEGGSEEEPVAFTGHRQDPEIELVYAGARYYDPAIGRFYSNDPVSALSFIEQGDARGFNRYAYAYNNPYKYIDPDGRVGVIAHSPWGDGLGAPAAAETVSALSPNEKLEGIKISLTIGSLVVGPELILFKGAVALARAGVVAKSGGIWKSSRIDAAKFEHIFSKKHVNKGVMDLGSSTDDILNGARNALMKVDKSGGLKDGMNTVVTRMNGHDATVRAFFKNGEMQSLNIFKGTTTRGGQNVVDIR